MKNRMFASQSAWVTGLAVTGLLFTIALAQAGKPAPPPAKPVAMVYTRSDGIWTMAYDGTSQKCILANIKNHTYGDATYSPNGQKLAFFRSAADGSELCLANSDGTGLVGLHTFPSGSFERNSRLVWSPDGTKLMFTSASGPEDLLYISISSPGVVNAVPVDVVPNQDGLAITKDLDPATPGYQGKAAFDGYYYDSVAPYDEHLFIAILDLTFDDAGNPQLGPGVDYISVGDNVPSYPAWSPDGSMLAFATDPADFSTFEPAGLHIMKLDWQAGVLAAYQDYIVDPGFGVVRSSITWSPDGRYLAYGRAGGYADLFRGTVGIDANGIPTLTNITNLTNTPKWTSESFPDWLPTWVAGQ